jgi:hypothetical protein
MKKPKKSQVSPPFINGLLMCDDVFRSVLIRIFILFSTDISAQITRPVLLKTLIYMQYM